MMDTWQKQGKMGALLPPLCEGPSSGEGHYKRRPHKLRKSRSRRNQKAWEQKNVWGGAQSIVATWPVDCGPGGQLLAMALGAQTRADPAQGRH